MKAFAISVVLAMVTVASGWALGEQAHPAIHLRDVVEVDDAKVLLSDLLPPDASPNIRAVSSAVELCRAPQPGSSRPLHEEQIRRAIASQPGLHVDNFLVPATVIIRSRGWSIKESDVRDAVSDFLGQHGSNDRLPHTAQLNLPEFLAATEPGFKLQVTRMHWDVSAQKIEVEVRCSNRKSCGKFLVRVVLPSTDKWPANLFRSISINSRATAETGTAAGSPSLVARGTSATLILEDANTRIFIPVVCLQQGWLNQRIRVFEKRSRQVFLAEVVGDHLLRANL